MKEKREIVGDFERDKTRFEGTKWGFFREAAGADAARGEILAGAGSRRARAGNAIQIQSAK